MSSHLVAKKTVIGHAELANAYGVTSQTLSVWLKKVPGLDRGKRNVIYFPKQQEAIFKHLGSPFQDEN